MNNKAAFVMPVKLSGEERELQHFRAAVDSIKKQTDPDWILVMVEDFSDNQKVYDVIAEMKEDLKDQLKVIYFDKNHGPGVARNEGIRCAWKLGAPFILFLDSDDIADPRRLELVRKAFEEDPTVNVVYTSFDVIDENDAPVSLDQISPSVREIIEGHQQDAVEGENAWISIAIKTNYTNLTSCTAVRTSLAMAEPFPAASVSEDGHTWMRYGAHPGKYVLLREIKGQYRICSHVDSRSRGANDNFYLKKMEADAAGFEEAVKLAKKHKTMGAYSEDEIRLGFYVRLALSMLCGESREGCEKCLTLARAAGRTEDVLRAIDRLCGSEIYKETMKSMAAALN